MALELEEKKDVMYVDKDIYQVANVKEIVNLKATNEKGNINVICGIIGKNIGLNRETINLYELLNKFTEPISKSEIVNIYCNVYNKSVSTFERSLDNLSNYNIIKITVNGIIILSSRYKLPEKACEAKYLIIEL